MENVRSESILVGTQFIDKGNLVFYNSEDAH